MDNNHDSSDVSQLNADKDLMLSELDSIKTELDALMKDSETAESKPSPSVNVPSPNISSIFGNSYLIVGILFLIVFFSAAQSNIIFLRVIASVSFAIAAVALIRVLADIMYSKRSSSFELLVGGAIALILTLSLMYFWTQILEPFKLVLFWILLVLLAINAFFYILHAYFGYIQRKGETETAVTGLILIISCIIALATFAYGHVLLYVLFVVVIALFCKATIDFSKRFRVKKLV